MGKNKKIENGKERKKEKKKKLFPKL